MSIEEQRVKAKAVFDKLDLNQNGFISMQEFNTYAKRHPQKLTHEAKSLMRDHDENNDQTLDFDEFFKLFRNNQWMFKDFCMNYCQLIMPPQCDRELQWPPPPTMIIFSIIEILTFVSDIIYFKSLDDTSRVSTLGVRTNGPVASSLIFDPRRRFEIWRYGSYMFVHVGLLHITMNLIIQIFLGVFLEVQNSWWRVTIIYVTGVVAGSMGQSIANPDAALAGASGGVYALITAHLATIILNFNEMSTAIIQLFFFTVFILCDIGMSVHRHIINQQDNVGYVAHMCGAIAGLLVGIAILRNWEVKRWEKMLGWCAVVVFSGLMMTGISVSIWMPNYFPAPRTKLYNNMYD